MQMGTLLTPECSDSAHSKHTAQCPGEFDMPVVKNLCLCAGAEACDDIQASGCIAVLPALQSSSQAVRLCSFGLMLL